MIEELLEAATDWAGSRRRPFDAELVSEVLTLREAHDDYPPAYWPARSAERLLLVTIPAYAQIAPDADRLGAALDTFWGFMRATGRMRKTSATPAELRKEAARALPRMAAAFADPANHSQARVLADFGRSIGIDLGAAAGSVDQVQARLDLIMESWNSLPEAERRRLMPDPSPKGLRSAEHTLALNDAAAQHSDDMIPRGDPEKSAHDARSAGFVSACLALADWVGPGKPVTSAGLLRPAVARQAYRELDLWPWERARQDRADGGSDPDLTSAEGDRMLAEVAVNSWRSAGDCLALDRLWWACTAADLVTVGRTTAARSPTAPETPEQWRDLALVLTVGLTQRLGEWACAPLIGVLGPAVLGDGVVALAEIREWWRGRCPAEVADILLPSWMNRLEEMLFHFDDCGLWRRGDRTLRLTDFGQDFAIVYLALLANDQNEL